MAARPAAEGPWLTRSSPFRYPPSAISSVNFPHHDIDARIDGDHVGEQVSLDHARNSGEVHIGRRTDAPPHRLRCAVRDEVVALFAFRAFDRDVGLADRRTRTFHHLLAVID